MSTKIYGQVGRAVANVIVTYLCAIYPIRAIHDPTRWNIFWALFWIYGFLKSAVADGIYMNRELFSNGADL